MISYKKTWNYINKSYWKWTVLISIVVFLVGITFWLFNYDLCFEQHWSKWLDALVSAGLIAIGLTIWISERNQDAKKDLPKRLTVHFMKDEKYVMTCHEAYLAGEGDIRAWGQQIGGQMAQQPFLSFYPYITQKGPDISKDRTFNLYEVCFYLKEIPYGNKRLENEYLVWIDNQDKSPKNKAWYEPNHPTNPLSIKEIEDRLSDSNEGKNISIASLQTRLLESLNNVIQTNNLFKIENDPVLSQKIDLLLKDVFDNIENDIGRNTKFNELELKNQLLASYKKLANTKNSYKLSIDKDLADKADNLIKELLYGEIKELEEKINKYKNSQSLDNI